MVNKLLQHQEKFETYSFAKRHGVLVTEIEADHIKAIFHPDCSPMAIIELRRFRELPLQLEEVTQEYFNNVLIKNYETKAVAAQQVAEDIGENLNLEQLLQNLPTSADLLESEANAPVIQLINALLREAINRSASDIHFETFEKTVSVRFRIDGILHNELEVPFLMAPLLISRIKVMARLDISEKRLPQDGRITVNVGEKSVDVRVSTIPVSHGERVVLRLLDKKSVNLNLAELGMQEEGLIILRRMISKPHGIILVTGPTGSGKTTTVYAALTELNVPGRNIMTVEDPVEYNLPGIAQIQVNTKVEMTFARSLRAILRQDPNVIMVGEIRDLETAIIAVQASLTGHLVFSTLHTNTAIGAITRLRDMGVESFLIANSVVGIIAQRLVRILCPHCKEAYNPPPNESELLNIPPSVEIFIYSPKGCGHCNQTGYIGRIGIYEMVEMDQQLRMMIRENTNEQALEKHIRTISPSMWQDGVRRVLSGDTSMEEILRVTTE